MKPNEALVLLLKFPLLFVLFDAEKNNLISCLSFLLLSVLFEMQSFGPSLVRLMSTATGRYLSMRRDGTLRGLVSEAVLPLYVYSI